MITALLLATLAATGLHLEESDLHEESTHQVMTSVARALEAASAERVRLDDPSWSSCDARDRCLADIRARTASEDVVFVRVFSGPSLVHVVLERVARTGEVKLVEVDLPRGAASWDEPLGVAVRQLPPSPLAVAEAADLSTDRPRADAAASVGPWLVFGAGASAAVAGAIFGVLANSARDELESSVRLDTDYDRLSGQLEDRALAANVLFAVAAGAAVTGVLWLVFE